MGHGEKPTEEKALPRAVNLFEIYWTKRMHKTFERIIITQHRNERHYLYL